MAQPKKLTFKQKQERKLLLQLETYKTSLLRIKKAMKTNLDDLETWRWAAMEVFKDLGKLEKHPEVDKWREYALELARECQIGMNFKN